MRIFNLEIKMKKQGIFILIILLGMTSSSQSRDLSPEEALKALKSPNYSDVCNALGYIEYNSKNSDRYKTEEIKNELFKVFWKNKNNEYDSSNYSGEYTGECVSGLYKAMGNMRDERFLQILIDNGDASGGRLMAYFGDKTADLLIEKYRNECKDENSPTCNGIEYLRRLIAVADSNILKRQPVSYSNLEIIRNIALEVISNKRIKDYGFRVMAIEILANIANLMDIPLIEKISKEDSYCNERDNPIEKVGDKYIRINKSKTFCHVREAAAKALEEIKAKKENMASAQTSPIITTVSSPELGNNQSKPSEIINKEISEKTNASEPEFADETTKSSRTIWYVALGIIIAIIIALSAYILIRKL
jgi:hypothetical protein